MNASPKVAYGTLMVDPLPSLAPSVAAMVATPLVSKTMDGKPGSYDKLKDVMGRYRTQSLFRETNYGTSADGLEPVWTLRDIDPQGKLPSLRRLYIDMRDPTGYTFAQAAFGSWKHWTKLKNLKWFQAHLDDWDIELEVAVRSDAIMKIQDEAEGGKSKYSASKWLAESGYHSRKAGRPSKEDIDRELKIATKVDEEIGEDAERLGLKVVNGS
jgi:hypothetical protein